MKDRACAMGVMALVLATAICCGLLVAWEMGEYREARAAPGSVLVLQAPEPGQATLDGPSDPAAKPQTGIDPAALTLWSVPVNLLIFVALGLYLRRDSLRSPDAGRAQRPREKD